MLGVDVFNALETLEAGAGAGEKVGGGIEFFLSLGGAGVCHEGVYYLGLEEGWRKGEGTETLRGSTPEWTRRSRRAGRELFWCFS